MEDTSKKDGYLKLQHECCNKLELDLQGKTCQMVINLVVVEFVEEHRKCSYRRFKGHRGYRMHTDYNIKPINQSSLGPSPHVSGGE